MTPRRVASVSLFLAAFVLLLAPTVFADPIGTFRWRLAPFCNVITLDAVSQATTITVSGTDDQCGASVAAATSGTAHVNPNGSIGLSLLVTRPDGLTISTSVDVDLTTLNGVWKDDAGNSGTFLFNPAAAPGDPRRITLKGVYSAGAFAAEAGHSLVSNFSFGRTLPAAPAAPAVNVVPFGGPATANCPGSFDDPRAMPGQLCLYERSRTNVEVIQIANAAGDLDVADTVGAHFAIRAAAAGAASVSGVWAVAIP
jgi:hypothetical protein